MYASCSWKNYLVLVSGILTHLRDLTGRREVTGGSPTLELLLATNLATKATHTATRGTKLIAVIVLSIHVVVRRVRVDLLRDVGGILAEKKHIDAETADTRKKAPAPITAQTAAVFADFSRDQAATERRHRAECASAGLCAAIEKPGLINWMVASAEAIAFGNHFRVRIVTHRNRRGVNHGSRLIVLLYGSRHGGTKRTVQEFYD